MTSPILACVLECSSIGSIILLTIFVVITRIGTNKDAMPIDTDSPRPEGDESPPTSPPSNT